MEIIIIIIIIIRCTDMNNVWLW